MAAATTKRGLVLDDATAATVAKIERLLRPYVRYKHRSYETSKKEHLPILKRHAKETGTGPSIVILGSSLIERMASMSVSSAASSSEASSASQKPQPKPKPVGPPVEVVLLGDSMLERMTTAGYGIANPLPRVGPWPSNAMMDDHTLNSLSLPGLPKGKAARLPSVLNLGVGGDRIQNMAYRLIGDDSPDPQIYLAGYLPLLAQMKSVKVWVVQAGTNNLTAKKGLVDNDVDALGALLRGLLMIAGEAKNSRVLLTSLFPRTDIADDLVAHANRKLGGLVRMMQGVPEFKDRVVLLPPTEEINIHEHLVDHVHLNLKGYQLWIRDLFPKVLEVLREVEQQK